MSADWLFLRTPIAHRGLHDSLRALPENSLPAVAAAVQLGWAVEVDVRLSLDRVAVVHHDASLRRMCGVRERVRDLDAARLRELRLSGTAARLPPLDDVLDVVAGQVPVLLDLKTGCLPRMHPAWVVELSRIVRTYCGPLYATGHNLAVVRRLAEACPQIPFGYTTSVVHHPAGSLLRCMTRPPRSDRRPRRAPQFLTANLSCLAHPWIQDCRARGLPLLGWTVRTERALGRISALVDNIIVEGEAARHLGAGALVACA